MPEPAISSLDGPASELSRHPRGLDMNSANPAHPTFEVEPGRQ